jgi:mRNA interferase MazF
MIRYVPEKGDFILVTFEPHSGHEQMGRRLAFVISNSLFNQHTALAIVCPLTNTDRQFPFHVAVPADSCVTWFVMVEHVNAIDFRARGVSPIGRAPDSLLEEVLSILDACLY